MIALQTILRTEVALYRYRADHGRFPETLAALIPAYLAAIPDDPFGGARRKSPRYKCGLSRKSFLLYSLGADLKDDGGKPTRWPGDDMTGDMVAGKLWQPRKP
jgi:hypothetical protein